MTQQIDFWRTQSNPIQIYRSFHCAINFRIILLKLLILQRWNIVLIGHDDLVKSCSLTIWWTKQLAGIQTSKLRIITVPTMLFLRKPAEKWITWRKTLSDNGPSVSSHQNYWNRSAQSPATSWQQNPGLSFRKHPRKRDLAAIVDARYGSYPQLTRAVNEQQEQ